MRRLVFNHIPKTGGTSVMHSIAEHVGGHVRVNWDGKVTEHDGDKPGLWSSHHAFHPQTFTPQPHDFWFTWVRDPVDMVYSAYYFYRKHPKTVGKARPLIWFDRVPLYDSVDKYVDAVLSSPVPFFPEGVYTGGMGDYHFVGRQHKMQEDLETLFRIVCIEGTPELKWLRVGPSDRSGYDYRRADVASRLSRDVEIFQSCGGVE